MTLLPLTAPNLPFIFTEIKSGTQIGEVLDPPPPQKSGFFLHVKNLDRVVAETPHPSTIGFCLRRRARRATKRNAENV